MHHDHAPAHQAQPWSRLPLCCSVSATEKAALLACLPLPGAPCTKPSQHRPATARQRRARTDPARGRKTAPTRAGQAGGAGDS